MVGRDPRQPHRAATPLELFFDLAFVVAIALAAERLHHFLSEGRVGHAVAGYLAIFFAIWWAWMNFTWFASAYDTDDDLYRLTTLVQIAGALVLAAGIPRAFNDGDFSTVTYGYVLMRLALVFQWLRAARSDPARRPAALRYAAGVTAVQVAWVGRLALPDEWLVPALLALVAADLLVPVWAERHSPTTWHPHHITERYSQFTMIVLGASVLAATVAVQVAIDTGQQDAALLSLAGAGLVIVFSMWWLYFDQPAHDLLTTLRRGFRWAYGHYFVFASAAAVGAGLAVRIDHETHTAHLPMIAAGYATALPVAVFLLAVWVLQIRPHRRRGPLAVAFPATAALVLATPIGPAPVQATAVLTAALVAVTVIDRGRPRADRA